MISGQPCVFRALQRSVLETTSGVARPVVPPVRPEVRWTCLESRRTIQSSLAAQVCGLLLVALFAPQSTVRARESGEAPQSRAESIRKKRQERAAQIPKAQPPDTDPEPKSGGFSPADLLPNSDGWGVAIGRVAPGQGYALGPSYRQRGVWNGRINWQASARASATKAWGVRAGFDIPSLFRTKVFAEAEAFHLHGPRYEYYGRGPDSPLSNYSNYRLEQNGLETRFGYRPARHLRLGLVGGFLRTNPGPGTRTDVAQVTDIFPLSDLAGVNDTTHFWNGGVFASYDSRDNPGGPRGGGLYQIRWDKFADGSENQFGFQRLRFEAQKFAPVFNKTNVVALRVHSTMTWVPEGRELPFYLQATLGGPRELRGFPRFRFHDHNAIIATAEYRWRLFSGMDAVAFIDAGKVTARAADINFSDLESSAGVGVRLRLQGDVFMRVETAYSHEGTQFWLRFSDIFRGLW